MKWEQYFEYSVPNAVEIQLAQLNYMLASYLGDKKAKPENFLVSPGLTKKPKVEEKEKLSPKELDKILRSMF